MHRRHHEEHPAIGRPLEAVTIAGRALLVAAAYFAAASYSMSLQELTGLGAPFWPGAGVAVTGLLLSPRRMWPAILLAVAVAETTNNLLAGAAPLPSAGWAVANLAEQFLAAWLIRRWAAADLASVQASASFLVAAFTAPIVGAGIGALVTTVSIGTQSYLVTAGQWLIGDALGIVTVVPVGLVLFGRLPSARLRSFEGILAIAAVTAAALIVFGLGSSNPLVAGRYLVLLPMLWASTRLGVAGAAVSLFIVAQLASGLQAAGFTAPDGMVVVTDAEASAQLKLFLAAVAAASLLLASRSRESETFHDLADSREQLIAAVSHELRTPLTAIVGFSELLLHRSGPLDDRARQAAEVIHRNGAHLNVLVEQLLQASRARGSQLPVDPEVVDVRALLDELVEQRSDEAIMVRPLDGGVGVVADRFHLVQIVTNLVNNALRHGAPPVEISVADVGEQIALSVADHGPGVPDWFVEHQFDDFSQAASGDRRGTVGLGLGLAISRTLAEANGGTLVYRTAAAGGACFVLTLPAAPPAGRESPDEGAA